MNARLLSRLILEAKVLWQKYPPRFSHPNKQIVFDLAGGPSRFPEGRLVVARYGEQPTSPLPERVPTALHGEGPFAYPEAPPGSCDFHVNFANAHLFCAYGAAAFAQDEIQVAEHPVLGSLREMLLAEAPSGLVPFTREDGSPTPVVILGAERWCAIDTDPELAFPYGIYGRRFASAKTSALRQAVSRVDGGPRTNLVAMDAPRGEGQYTEAQIRDVLVTATTAFAACRAESQDQCGVVHTGHWGTGAYGGHRTLMAIVQLIAARFADIDSVVYHSIDAEGREAFEAARAQAEAISGGATLDHIVDALHMQGFVWGRPDGN